MHNLCMIVHLSLVMMCNIMMNMAICRPIQASTDLQKIKATVQYYFAAESHYSPELAQRAYHDLATFSYVDEGNVIVNSYSMIEYLKGLAQKTGQVQARKLSVDNIDISGNLASVSSQILCMGKGKRINDYLSLIKEKGEWKIVHRLSFKEYASFEKPTITTKGLHEKTINTILLDYLKGRELHDNQVLEMVFHPNSDILHVHAHGETVNQVSLKNFINFHSSQKGRRFKHKYRIHFISCKGNIAIAKIQTRYKYFKTNFTEYVSLALIEDQWKIVKKLSHQDTSIKTIIL